MYLDPAHVVIMVIIVLMLYNAYRYISWRIASWIGTAVLVLVVMAVIAPYQTRIMVHQLWYGLLEAFHRIFYVLS